MTMRPEQPILEGASLRDFFRELLGEVRERQRLEVDDSIEFYLVDLLSAYGDPARVWVREEDGSLQQEPLALILARALEAGPEERAKALRRIGDTSLWVSGFFPDSLEPRLVDASYYMSMGHLAYSRLAALKARQPVGGLYEEMAAKFSSLVDLLNEVSERVSLTTYSGMLRVYERFLKTGSARLARMLAEEGMTPILARPLREVQ